MPLNTGALIHNRYRIARLIGQGGFGAVYRAWDTSLNRPCALKENLDTSQEAQRQFEREARTLAGLIHPHLPRVIDHFIVPGQGQYLVMDFVEGEDLASLLARGQRVTEEQALTWIGQVAEALVYLHNQPQPVIHRDIKPANIRVTPEGKAMLVDFGLVKVYDVHLKTTVGARAITPGYSPPEQYGRGSTDHRTDIYALAATLYTLLTAQEPTESIQRVVGDPLVPVDTLNSHVSSHLARVLEQAMALNPSQRYQSTKEFASALTVPVVPSKQVITRQAHPPKIPAMNMGKLDTKGIGLAKTWLATWWLPLSGGVLLILLLILGTTLFVRDKQSVATNNATVTAIITRTNANVAGTGDDLALRSLTTTANTNTISTAVAQTANAGATGTAITQIVSADATSTVIAQVASIKVTSTAVAQIVNAEAVNIVTDDTISADRLEMIKAETGLSFPLAQLVFGPQDGTLVHPELETYSTGVDLENFVVEATFFNPYPRNLGSWDYGFIFGDSSNGQLRLLFFGDQTWKLSATYKYEMLDSGSTPFLWNYYGQSNHIVWIHQADQGTLYVNGRLIDSFDVSAKHFSGDVALITGAVAGNWLEGQGTMFTNFTLWSLP